MTTPEIGHNNPPEDTPFEVVTCKILDLYDEAKNWCDGEPIKNPKQAEKVNKLINELRAAERNADELRKTEVKPLNEAKAAIQDRYNPLIKKDAGKTSLALEMCKLTLAPWLLKLKQKKEEDDRRVQEEADEAKRRADEAMAAAKTTGNLALREQAEQKVQDAQLAEVARRKVQNRTANVKGEGRASTLRKKYVPEIVDMKAVAGHYWNANRDGLMVKIMEMVVADFGAGHRDIPGVKCVETFTAV